VSPARWFFSFPLRLRALLRRRRVEDELDEEFRFHLDTLVDQHLARGMRPDEARHLALRALDGIELRKEEYRDARGLAFIDHAVQDVRYTLRGMRRAPVSWPRSSLSDGARRTSALLFRPRPGIAAPG
jgi:hypothetical protein